MEYTVVCARALGSTPAVEWVVFITNQIIRCIGAAAVFPENSGVFVAANVRRNIYIPY
jgi:hypothetical protein